MIISLVGCGNKPQSTTIVDDAADKIEVNEEVKQTDRVESGYALDNRNKPSGYSELDIYPENVVLAEPYKYEYTTQSKDPEIEDNTENIEMENIEIENTDIENTDDESVDNAEDIVYSKEDAIYDIGNILNSIYYNGYILLNGQKSVDKYNESHLIDMWSVIYELKSNLERIDYCDNLISTYLSNETNLVSSWEKLKPELSSYQIKLSEVESAEDYINKDISSSVNISKNFNRFMLELDNVKR